MNTRPAISQYEMATSETRHLAGETSTGLEIFVLLASRAFANRRLGVRTRLGCHPEALRLHEGSPAMLRTEMPFRGSSAINLGSGRNAALAVWQSETSREILRQPKADELMTTLN